MIPMTVQMAIFAFAMAGGERELAVAHVETDQPVVALTFDACATMGQANDFDRAVFDILKSENIAATVFVSGRWLQKHPDEGRLLAEAPLVEFGNHGFAHLRLSALSPARLAAEIERTEALIAALGRKSTALRPPFGDWNAKVVHAARQQGLSTVLWDVVSADAGGHVSARRMARAVTAQARPGSIVIFHINGRGPFTRDALPEIIKNLRARGLRFVSVSELLATPGARLVPASLGTRVPPKPQEAHADHPN